MLSRIRFTINDLWLVVLVVIWGLNLTVLKVIFREVTPLATNMVRFTVATLAFLILISCLEGHTWRLRRGDWPRVALLGLLGHTGFQLCFVMGLNRTSVTHSALIFGSTPLVVALLSRWVGHERLNWPIWAGLVASFTGVALTVTGKQEVSGRAVSTLGGDLMIFGAVLMWALYTVFGKPLLARYSPLRFTGLSMAVGSVPLIVISLPACREINWTELSVATWAGLAYSSLGALLICYLIWYRSVARVGNSRTAAFENLVPVVGAALAWWLLGEGMSLQLILGGAFILGGVTLTRLSGRARDAAPRAAPRPAAASGA
ncbi:MAG: DMT family transporter [Acidobacteriota bacterium]